jgi:hypothetical protein
VACNHMFVVPFYFACMGPPIFLLDCYIMKLQSWWPPMHKPTSSCTTSHLLLASFLAAEKKERY